jgi:hypothetical protein
LSTPKSTTNLPLFPEEKKKTKSLFCSLMEPPEDKRKPLDSAEEVILWWDSTASEEVSERENDI